MAGPSIAHRAIGYGMPGIRVDGNDVLACYAVMAEAAERARARRGPTLIEAITYRMGPHTTSDDPTRYRSADEVDEWLARDPIARYRTYLQNAGVLDERLEQRVAARSQRLRAEVRDSLVGAATPIRPNCSTTCTPRSPRIWHANAISCWPNWRRRRETSDPDHRSACRSR